MILILNREIFMILILNHEFFMILVLNLDFFMILIPDHETFMNSLSIVRDSVAKRSEFLGQVDNAPRKSARENNVVLVQIMDNAAG